MRAFIYELFFRLGFDKRDACADDKALYVELIEKGGVRRYIKLTPSEVSVEEYNNAWDYSLREEKTLQEDPA